MSALIVVHVDTPDPQALAAYQPLARQSMKEYGVRMIAKGSADTVLEGEPPGPLTVVLEADSAERARAWYTSAGYTEAIRAREGKARVTMVITPKVG